MGVDRLEPVAPVGRRGHARERVEQLHPEAAAVDRAAVGGESERVRPVAGGDSADQRVRARVDDLDDVGGQRGDEQARAVRRELGVVGAQALDLQPPQQRMRAKAERRYVAEVAPRDVEDGAFR